MSDFQRAFAIRNGELDDEMPTYEELTGWLQRVPDTWLHGLVFRVVSLSVVKNVFNQDGGLERTVERAKQAGKDHPQTVLRD
jgi:hypothetical protein